MGDQFQFDVFISYSSKDEDWVIKALLPRLEQADIKVCIDFRDFTPGTPALHNMREASKHSRRTLLVMTPDWVASEWTSYENILSRTSDPAGLQRRTIPLLLEKCEVPEDISILTFVNFTRADRLDNAWRQLLTALEAPPEQPRPKEPEHPAWYLEHPYPMPPNFTGRVSERGTLTRWLNEDAAHPLLVLRALGGFGKSALVWHWLTHDVDAKQWPRVIWWSFYEGDASFDHFVTEALQYLDDGQAGAHPISAREALVALLKVLHQPGTLFVLDGFERVLRAFSGLEAAYQGDEAKHTDHDRDCVSPLAEDFLYNSALQPQLRSKVLLTSRLIPRIVEAKGGGHLQGCREVPLLQMQPEDAVAFFHAQGIRGTHTEIELACESYGYHPLSLRLLAGLIIGDFQQPGDIVAAKRLDVSGDLVQRQHHVLEQAYDSLTPARRRLLSTIACFRWPVSYDTLKTVAESEDALDRDLHDLISRGLLHHEVQERRFDLHPIVRRYAYDRLAAPERVASHTRLRDYFAAVPGAENVARLDDLTPVIELFHHTVRSGQFDDAFIIFRDRIWQTLYYQLGAYQLQIDLLRALLADGEAGSPRLEGERHLADTLNELANAYSLSGQSRSALLLYEQHNAISELLGETSKRDLAIGLGNVALLQIRTGALQAAEANLYRRIALCREIKDEFNEAVGHQQLGRLLVCRGEDAKADTEFTMALEIFERQNNKQWQGVTWAYCAQRELLSLRSVQDPARHNPNFAIAMVRRALESAEEIARTRHPYERDYVRAHWLLGAGYRVASQHDEAESYLHDALGRCRRINMVDLEADILIDLARLRAATNLQGDARRFAEEAQVIADRSGYVLQGADALLELAKLALYRDDPPLAREHAQQAKDLATCDGPPDYTYKAAYDEAVTLLQQLG